MSCPHAESTAILYLFGEAPEEYAAHLEGCAICQNVILEHQETVEVITPHIPVPSRRRLPVQTVAPIAAIFAIAAVLLLTVRLDLLPSNPPLNHNADITVERFFEADNDSRLLALELELALMHLEDD